MLPKAPPIALRHLLLAGIVTLGGCHGHHHVAVTTYHFDNLRSGWNSHEDRLTLHAVAGPHFGLLYSAVALDDQVDVQPLVVPDVTITAGAHAGKYDVVYVATESNTVYAIDSATGTILLQTTLAPAVNMTVGPPPPYPPNYAYSCGNNGPYVGINGTPVIDRVHNMMYVVAFSMEGGGPVYRIHALNLSNLSDTIQTTTPTGVLVGASQNLVDHSLFNFNAGWQRQRPALVESNGNIYAAFGSFCDWGGYPGGTQSRGWVLGWNAGTLAALPHAQLNDQLATAPDCGGIWGGVCMLSSVWMSGYGPAADNSGNIYFVTGNSDSNLTGSYYTTYDGSPNYHNIQNSVVRVLPDLSAVHDIFTPWAESFLDEVDADFGSAGAMLLPDLPGPVPHLVAAGGKDGKLYILNRDNLGGYNAPSGGAGATDNVVAEVNIGACWCGPSYFDSGEPHIVSSGGTNVMVWRVVTSPAVSLVLDGTAVVNPSSQDGGFFTAISSDGPKDTIIWAVSRPDGANNMWLSAFDARPPHGSATLTSLLPSPLAVGTWNPAISGGNTDVVPVIANGKVYVAANHQLFVFGLK